MLNREILPFNFLLKLLSLHVALGRLLKAMLDLALIVRVTKWLCACSAFRIVAIVEFVQKVKIMPVVINGFCRTRHHEGSLCISIDVRIKCFRPVNKLMFVSTLLGAKAKADCIDTIFILRIASSRII